MLIKILTIFFWIIFANHINSLSVGVIQHGLLLESNVTLRITRSTCDECLCLMSTDSISSMNCFSNQVTSSSMTCEFFADQFNLSLNSSQIKISFNSTFYYLLFQAPTCSTSGHGSLSHLNSSTPDDWTQYSYNYTATSIMLTLMFGFQTGLGCDYFFDDVSIVNIDIPNTQLLKNPSFENSTTVVNYWNTWCTDTCSNSNIKIDTNSKCHLSTGTCLKISCRNSITFISQSVSTVIGRTYTISYWLSTRACNDARNQFYFDIF